MTKADEWAKWRKEALELFLDSKSEYHEASRTFCLKWDEKANRLMYECIDKFVKNTRK
jgi:hypothetical protein